MRKGQGRNGMGVVGKEVDGGRGRTWEAREGTRRNGRGGVGGRG